VWAAGFLVFAVRDGVAWSLAILSRPGELLSRIRDSKSVSASLIRRIPPQLIVYNFEAGQSGQPAARLLKEFLTRIIASSLRRTLASVRPSVASRLTFRTCDVKGLGKVEDCALVMLELFQVFMHCSAGGRNSLLLDATVGRLIDGKDMTLSLLEDEINDLRSSGVDEDMTATAKDSDAKSASKTVNVPRRRHQ